MQFHWSHWFRDSWQNFWTCPGFYENPCIRYETKKVVPQWNSFSNRERNLSGCTRAADSPEHPESLSRLALLALSLSGYHLQGESRQNNTERILLRIFLLRSQPCRDTADTPLNDYIVKIHATALRSGCPIKVTRVYVTWAWIF